MYGIHLWDSDSLLDCCIAHHLCGTVSRWELNPIKLAYNPSRPAQLTAITFNQLDQYANNPGETLTALGF